MSLLPFIILHTATMSNLNRIALSNKSSSGISKRLTVGSYYNNRPIVKKDILDYSTESSLFLKDKFVKQCLSEIQKDKKVSLIIKELVEKTQELKLADEKKLHEKFLDLCEKYEQEQKELQVFQKDILDMGFTLNYADYNKKLGIKRADNSVGFTFENALIYNIFNDRSLTKEVVLNGVNIYQQRLDEFIIKNSNVKRILEIKQMEYDALSKKKFLLKISKKTRERLDYLSIDIRSLTRKYQEECKLRKQAELYESLSKDQKQIILDYLTKIENFEKLCDTIKQTRQVARILTGKLRSPKDADNYRVLVSKRISDAKKELSEKDLRKLEKFLNQLANKMANATKEQLQQMQDLDVSKIEATEDTILVYKYICSNVKEKTFKIRKEQATEKDF